MPEELSGLWSDGFRAFISVVSSAKDSEERLSQWVQQVGTSPIGLIPLDSRYFVDDIVLRYTETRSGRLILRLRDASGLPHRLDVTSLDDPEHPLLSRYELLTEDTLLPLLPTDLRPEEVERFFKDPRSSWRPYAAGMPWRRDPRPSETLKLALRKIDREGVTANRLLNISAESGAGATTFLRDLAWSFAAEGYPTLLAKPSPFTPSGIEVASYMSRCLEAATNAGIGEDTRIYQAPWVVFFDRSHWEGNEDKIISFSRELEKSGRRACILFITGPQPPLAVFDRRIDLFYSLTHQVLVDDVLNLGRHINKFLPPGATRSEADWRNFFERSVVGQPMGVATFWIALSFWLQRQIDMNETIQTWLYRQFRTTVHDPILRRAIIEIAAMSTEHQALPEALLPISGDWPTAQKLADLQSQLGALGIVRLTGDRGRYWALIHDLLGRLLLNALFYDYPSRVKDGFEVAENAENMRMIVLKQIASSPELARKDLREVANAFATSIFKIDPEHGHSAFSPYWREALAALDGMPRAFRTTSRTFLHHAAVSRRRVAKDRDNFDISDDERADLLVRAIADLEAALSISGDDDSEPDINILNSLAHGFHDLADVQTRRSAPEAEIEDLRAKGRETTRRAYRLDPDNSFVIETYARDLLSSARSDPQIAAGNAIEVLGIVYASMERISSQRRRFSLARLADDAFEVLLLVAIETDATGVPQTESDAIVAAFSALVGGVVRFDGMQLTDYPSQNRRLAADKLADPLLQGNPQAVRLRYLITCLEKPHDFTLQLELLELLQGSSGIFTPQLDLELAILLHQRDRHHEASRKFRELRHLWRQGGNYVEVPVRLRWLLVRDKSDRRQVHARVSAGGDGRYGAKVREMQEADVVFRPQEFGQHNLRPGMVVNGLISFGHNGPFLRPLTAT
jgi:hypothetical protein